MSKVGEPKKKISKEILANENIAWARFLYKQYKKKKLKQSLSFDEKSIG
ncbi:MAG: hypothetical protein WC080_04695 [Patescibacteria group bacterium]|jgi:hypothetical protein